MKNSLSIARTLLVAAALAALGQPPARAQEVLPPARAQEAPPPSGDQLLSTLVTLMQALVDSGVLSAAKAQEMLRQAGLDPALLNKVPTPPPPKLAEAPPPPVVRVPYVPQMLKVELREELKQDVIARARSEHWFEPGILPAWIYKLNWYGDVRFRVEREDYASDNAPPEAIDAYYQLPLGTTTTTINSRNRPRLRARLGVDAEIDDHFSANIMLVTTTGTSTSPPSPVSYNSDQGQYGRPFYAGIDLAYLQWAPVSSFHLTGGRVVNPYLSTDSPFLASDLIWWPDLSFDGIFASYTPRFSPAWGTFVNAGVHPLQTNQLGPFNTAPQQWLYAGQTGMTFEAADKSQYRFGVSYFSYVGIQGDLNPVNPPLNTLNSLSAPLFRQRGNTMFDINWFSNPGTPLWGYAGQFKELEINADIELAHFDPLRIGADLDFERNVGFHANDDGLHIGQAIQGLPLDNTGANGLQRPRLNAYEVRLLAGRHAVHRLGDWQAFGGYRYLERDSVVDAFTSPDYHLGGTDQKGPFIGTFVGLGTNVSMILRYSATKPIDAAPNFEINEWFLDFLGTF